MDGWKALGDDEEHLLGTSVRVVGRGIRTKARGGGFLANKLDFNQLSFFDFVLNPVSTHHFAPPLTLPWRRNSV